MNFLLEKYLKEFNMDITDIVCKEDVKKALEHCNKNYPEFDHSEAFDICDEILDVRHLSDYDYDQVNTYRMSIVGRC